MEHLDNHKTEEEPREAGRDIIMERMRDTAEEFVRSTGNPAFDYSVESLEVADAWLEEIRGDGELTAEKVDVFTVMIGSYVFEVARRNFGGTYQWSPEYEQPVLVTGLPEFAAAIMALDKVEKRLRDGSQESLPFWFRGYMDVIEGKGRALVV